MSQLGKFRTSQSIKLNKDLIHAKQVKAYPELGTAQPQLFGPPQIPPPFLDSAQPAFISDLFCLSSVPVSFV